ncbi:MAG: aldose 1-epimerase family protein, partial [Eubacterium sp.]|nr:aldose 1-epimerase family protein [Eubacterium sp.]
MERGGMHMSILENDRLKVTVSDHGAELCSVVDKATGCERIWCADPAVWNRHAPILFPFVGKVTEGKYRVGGREYRMKTQHGFARDMDFCCVEETASSVTHCLTSTEATKEIYPYDFRLQVKH